MNDRDQLAAEHALRLLEGEELMEALRLTGSDPAFAAAVAEWEEKLAPLLDEIGEAAPGPDLWPRIREVIAAQPGSAQVVALQRRVRSWRFGAAAAGAVAAALALFILVAPLQSPAPPPVPAPAAPVAAPVLVASVAGTDEPVHLTVAFEPSSDELLVTPGRIAAADGRAHELWIIPADGTPRSLGLVQPDGPQRRRLPPQLAAHFSSDATVAVSVEPAGGSPTGLPTGPVVATGTLAPV
jgi:anti-sigma-K factor RskA